ncbi:MAG: transposase [Bacteroidales bacterium]
MKIKYNNLYVHFVFTTNQRRPLIKEKFRERLEKYITGIVKNHSSRLYAIYANPEHMHFLISKAPDLSEQQIASIISNSSENFINEVINPGFKFHWQNTASAFSVSKSAVKRTCQYIYNQPEHHKKVTYKEENDELIKYYQETLIINK